MADVNQILRAYGKQLRKNVRLNHLAENAWNYKDAHDFASKAAELLCDVLKLYMDPATVTYDDAVQIFTAVMKKNHEEVARVCAKAQNDMYKKAGVGLKALTPDFNADKARGLATVVTDTEEITDDYIRTLIKNNSLAVVDDSIRVNAAAATNLGLAVHITRTYDDVGLHNGKDVCQWCMDRVGDWTDYGEAFRAGAFERHPGCGCMIEYHVGKTHTWQNRAGGWNEF
jgi:hypothetical protein